MPKNTQGGKKHKKVKRVDKNILPKDVDSMEYIIAKVTKIHNKCHCDVKTMDGNNVEDIYCSTNNSVRFIKLNDLVLIYKYNTENHFIKRNNMRDSLEKKKSIIVTLLDAEKLNKLMNKHNYVYIEDKNEKDNDFDIVFENDNLEILNEDKEIDENEINIDDI